jgi:hypothetical protein
VSTEEELNQYLRQWTQRQQKSYSIGVLSFHGYPGGILIGKKHIPLARLGEMLQEGCRGRLIHFDSCETMKIAPKEIEEFRTFTKATAVSGFTEGVD